MANVLLTWELGYGLGHLVNLLPLARGLTERGHNVFVALNDLSRAMSVFGNLPIRYLQAPRKARRTANRIEPMQTVPHILHNCGFSDFDELRVLVAAWRSVYDVVGPDVIVFEHSPMALLAARGLQLRRVLLGAGFWCPMYEHPMRNLRPWMKDNGQQLLEHEICVLDVANRTLDALGERPLDCLASLFRTDAELLLTLPELDNYPDRPHGDYFGVSTLTGGAKPAWPKGSGKRIYAYLKWATGVPDILEALERTGLPTIVSGDGISPTAQERFSGSMIRFESRLLDLDLVSRECHAAILNGTHNTTVKMLLAGKPILQLPLNLEQSLNSMAVARMGAGIVENPTSPRNIRAKLRRLLDDEALSQGAVAFARRYDGYSPSEQIERLINQVEQLLC